MSFFCRLGWHTWSQWSDEIKAEWTQVLNGKEYTFDKYVQHSHCVRCNKFRRAISD